MLKGDAFWDTKKRILGWDIDTVASTLNLPVHRLDRLYMLLDMLRPPPKKRVFIKLWHQLLGELRSMAPALPGARGLFLVLQDAFGHPIGIGCASLAVCRTWSRTLPMSPIPYGCARPVYRNWFRPLPRGLAPLTRARTACEGFGSMPPIAPSPPVLWRTPYSADVRAKLVTAENPRGDVSISDLELLAMIAHKDVPP